MRQAQPPGARRKEARSLPRASFKLMRGLTLVLPCRFASQEEGLRHRGRGGQGLQHQGGLLEEVSPELLA